MSLLKTITGKHEGLPAVGTAASCEACLSAIHWRNAYGVVRCWGCHRPASQALVRQKLVVVHGEGGQMSWGDYEEALAEAEGQRAMAAAVNTFEPA